MVLTADNSRGGAQRFEHVWAATISWVALLVGLVAVSVVSDNIPFGGMDALFAAGGRTALRIFALGIPVAVSLVFWAVALFLGQLKFRKSLFVWWMGGLYVLVILSTIFAINPKIAFFGYWYSEQGFLMWTLFFLIAFLASQLVTSNTRLIQLLATILGAAVYVGGLGLLEVAGLRPLSSQALEWYYERGSSTMMNPDFLGTYLVVPTLLGIGLTVALSGWKRYLAAAGTLVSLASLMFTLTRGAWLGVGVGLVALSIGAIVIHYLAAKREGAQPATAAGYVRAHAQHTYPTATIGTVALIWVVVLVAVLALVFVVPGGERIVQRIQFTIEDPGEFAGTLSGRLPLWKEMWSATMAHPVLGAGPDNMMYAWQSVVSQDYFRYAAATTTVNSAHSVYLDLAVEFGLPYAILFLAGVIALVGQTILALQRSAKAAPFVAWEVVSLPIAAFGLGASFLVGMTVVPILAVAFAVVGATVAVGTKSSGELRPVTRYGVLALAAVIGILLVVWATASGTSAVVGNQATNQPQLRVQRNLAALKRAPWRVYPAIDLVSAADQAADDQLKALGLTKASAYDRLLAADPERSLNYYNAGNYYLLNAGNAQRALELAERSLVLQPVNVPAMLLRGDALCDIGDYEKGLAALAESVRIESCSPPALSWEAPWDVYLTRLLEVALADTDAAADAKSTFAVYETRFPGSSSLEAFRTQVEALP